MRAGGSRATTLATTCTKGALSDEGKIAELKRDLLTLTGDVNFKRAANMGEILQAALDFVRRNYQNHSPFAK